jgi:hypothetical protein
VSTTARVLVHGCPSDDIISNFVFPRTRNYRSSYNDVIDNYSGVNDNNASYYLFYHTPYHRTGTCRNLRLEIVDF